MEVVKRLLRYVSRGFYGVRSVIIMDALLIHIVLTDEEMVSMLGIPRKDLRALCAKLKEDHLITDRVQKEDVGHSIRTSSKTYYYIHYTEAIDAIKWKMHSIVNKIKDDLGSRAHPQGYICPVCHSTFSPLEVLVNVAPDDSGFLCEVCGNLLIEDDSTGESAIHQEKLGKLMNQIQPIIDALKKIDEISISENTFESSMAVALPAPGDGSQINPAVKARKDTKINNTTLQVKITSDQESAEMARKQKEERVRLAAENALPAWHMESTVGKSLISGNDNNNSDSQSTRDEETKKPWDDQETKDTKAQTAQPESTDQDDKDAQDALAAFYAQLAAKRQEENDEEDEDEEDDEDEDDDDEEFEDVATLPIGGNDNDNEDDDDDDDEDDD